MCLSYGSNVHYMIEFNRTQHLVFPPRIGCGTYTCICLFKSENALIKLGENNVGARPSQ